MRRDAKIRCLEISIANLLSLEPPEQFVDRRGIGGKGFLRRLRIARHTRIDRRGVGPGLHFTGPGQGQDPVRTFVRCLRLQLGERGEGEKPGNTEKSQAFLEIIGYSVSQVRRLSQM